MDYSSNTYPPPDDDFFVAPAPAAATPKVAAAATFSRPPAGVKAPMPPSRIDRAKSVGAVLAAQAQNQQSRGAPQPNQPPAPPARVQSGSLATNGAPNNFPSSQTAPPAVPPRQTAPTSTAPPLPSRTSRSDSQTPAPSQISPNANGYVGANQYGSSQPPLPQRPQQANNISSQQTSNSPSPRPAQEFQAQVSTPIESPASAAPPPLPQRAVPPPQSNTPPVNSSTWMQETPAQQLTPQPSDFSTGPKPYHRKFCESNGLSPSIFVRSERFAFLDNIAASLHPSNFQTVEDLAFRLFDNLSFDVEKARIAFSWISKHIKFDANLWELNVDAADYRVAPATVLQQGSTSYIGFANLFFELSKLGQFNCVIIEGVQRQNLSARCKGCRSAWNAFQDGDGTWYLVDCGYMAGFEAFKYGKNDVNFPDFFFSTYPDLFNQYNCPDDPKWQLVADKFDEIEPRDYNSLPEPCFDASFPMRFVKPFPGFALKPDTRLELSVECARTPCVVTVRGQQHSESIMKANGSLQWRESVFCSSDVTSISLQITIPELRKKQIACAFHGRNFDDEAFQSAFDALGPAGFYGEADTAMKAPLIADEYRIQICRKCADGQFNFAHVDSRARNCPNFGTVEETVNYLIEIAPSELERTRVIFVWVATHIAYDWNAYVTGQCTSGSSPTFQDRRAVCAGYASLFHKMAKLSGLHSYVITGVGAGMATSGGAALGGHAWNAVLIEGEMFLLDACWAAGTCDPASGFTFRFNPVWFLTPPAEFAKKHLPSNPIWQLLAKPITMEEFKRRQAEWESADRRMSPFCSGFEPEPRVVKRTLSSWNLFPFTLDATILVMLAMVEHTRQL